MNPLSPVQCHVAAGYFIFVTDALEWLLTPELVKEKKIIHYKSIQEDSIVHDSWVLFITYITQDCYTLIVYTKKSSLFQYAGM